MDVKAIKAQVAQVQAGIAGVKTTFATAPAKLNKMDLPAFVNFTGEASYRAAGYGRPGVRRTFLMRLYVAPIAHGLPGEVESLVEPFFERVMTAFAAAPALGESLATLTGDGGVAVFEYAGGEYLGVEFRLEVED
jgi:hypothetical protein